LSERRYAFRVDVESRYLPEQSRPENGLYAFAYGITIVNTGTISAQLVSRHWIITDANNQVMEVKGPGVVGHQPLLKPGERFEYTSGSQLRTPSGSMKGSYFCVAEDGYRFETDIPEFALVMPRTLH
jgi:ApaG protein